MQDTLKPHGRMHSALRTSNEDNSMHVYLLSDFERSTVPYLLLYVAV
jgi:hypothetical protein